MNKKLNNGINLNGLIQKTPLKFFNFTYMEIDVFDNFLTIGLTPQFDHRNVTAELFDPDAWAELGDMLYPDEFDMLWEDDLLQEVDAHITEIKDEALKVALTEHQMALHQYGL